MTGAIATTTTEESSRHRSAVVAGAGILLISVLAGLANLDTLESLVTLGLIGYPTLLAGCLLDLFNVVDITQGIGLVALVPGGIFELLLPIWLLAKGFTYPREAHNVRHHR